MHAFAILAHNDPAMAARLASRLATVGDVYAHVDAKSPMSEFSELRRHARVLDARVPVYWGGWNMVVASLMLASRALENPDTTAVTLLSGHHYPLQAPERIVEQPVRDRIRLIPSPDPSQGKPASRFRARYVSRFPPASAASVLTNAVARRLPAPGPEHVLAGRSLYAGSSWWSLTRQTLTEAIALLDRDKPLVRHFRRVASPDEALLHTAVGAVLEEREQRPATDQVERETTFVSWDGGRHPEPLDTAMIDRARDDGWWFARKFTSSRPALTEHAEAGWR